jgi:hypothetical protein
MPEADLTKFTDGSRLDSGDAGISVVWHSGQRWVGLKIHMGCDHELRRCPRQGAGNCSKATDDLGEGHDLHRRPGRYQAHGLGGT